MGAKKKSCVEDGGRRVRKVELWSWKFRWGGNRGIVKKDNNNN